MSGDQEQLYLVVSSRGGEADVEDFSDEREAYDFFEGVPKDITRILLEVRFDVGELLEFEFSDNLLKMPILIAPQNQIKDIGEALISRVINSASMAAKVCAKLALCRLGNLEVN